MKLTFFFLISFLITACQPGFHRQKYTNFGHLKKSRLLNPVSDPEVGDLKETTQIYLADAAATVIPEDLPAKDTAETRETVVISYPEHETNSTGPIDCKAETPQDPIQIADITNYRKTLKFERDSNAIAGSFFMILLVLTIINGYLPAILFLAACTFIFLLLFVVKQLKYNRVLHDPAGNPNPKDKRRFSKDNSRAVKILNLLALIISGFTAAAAAFTLALSFLVGTISLTWTIFPFGVVLVLLIFSAILCRNHNRGLRLRGLETDSYIIGMNVNSWVMMFLWGFLACMTYFYKFLNKF